MAQFPGSRFVCPCSRRAVRPAGAPPAPHLALWQRLGAVTTPSPRQRTIYGTGGSCKIRAGPFRTQRPSQNETPLNEDDTRCVQRRVQSPGSNPRSADPPPPVNAVSAAPVSTRTLAHPRAIHAASRDSSVAPPRLACTMLQPRIKRHVTDLPTPIVQCEQRRRQCGPGRFPVDVAAVGSGATKSKHEQ